MVALGVRGGADVFALEGVSGLVLTSNLNSRKDDVLLGARSVDETLCIEDCILGVGVLPRVTVSCLLRSSSKAPLVRSSSLSVIESCR